MSKENETSKVKFVTKIKIYFVTKFKIFFQTISNFCLCKAVVVFLIQDVIYAVLTEHFHNRATASTNNTATTSTDHLIGLFNGDFWKNEWFWLIFIVSLTFYFSQVNKLGYNTIRDTQNKDSIEKLKEIAQKKFNPIEDLKALLETGNCDIEKLQEKKKEAQEFSKKISEEFENLSIRVDNISSGAKSPESDQ